MTNTWHTTPKVVKVTQRAVRICGQLYLALPLLLERLTNRLTLLREGAQDLPERQRTLQSAIAWSYELLTAAQQRCFRALSVFLGGWTLSAAEVVCWKAGVLAVDEVLLALAVLIDHSLVSSETSAGGTSRFSMLETLREYALERLRTAGEEEQARRQHAIYYAELAKTAASPRMGQQFHDAELIQELVNVRAALHWAARQRAAVPGLQLAAYAGRIFIILGQNSEGSVWLEKMLELDSQAGEDAAPLPVRLAALYAAGWLERNLGRTERAATLSREELSLAEHLGDHASMSSALASLGNLAQARGDLAEAADHFEQSYHYAQMGEDRRAHGQARMNLASIAIAQRDFARARAILEENLEQNRAEQFNWGIANAATMLGQIAREQQQYALARSRYRESLPLYHAFGNLSYTAMCLEGIAALACAEGHFEQAVRLCAHAAALRMKAQTPLPPREQKAFENVVSMARSALGEDVFAAAWGQGAVLTPEEGFALALSGIGEDPTTL
jgi:tetratricopeptide (TPR) repeat protein